MAGTLAFAGFSGTVGLTDTHGQAQSLAECTIYAPDDTLAVLWTDRTKTVGAANPTHSDANGELVFFASTVGPHRVSVALASGTYNREVNVDYDYQDVATVSDLVDTKIWHRALDHGCVGDGATDDGAALQALCDALSTAGGGVVYLDDGHTFLLGTVAGSNKSLLTPRSNVTIIGGQGSVLKAAGGLNDAAGGYFNVIFPPESTNLYTVHDFALINVTVDLNGTNNLLPAAQPNKKNAALGVLYGARIRVEGCRFLDNAGQQSLQFGQNAQPATVTDVVVLDNSFERFAGGVAGNVHASDHSAVYARADRVLIAGNTIGNDSWVAPSGGVRGTAIEVHASDCRVIGNTVRNVNAGVNLCFQVADAIGVVVEGNTVHGCRYGVHLFGRAGFVARGIAIIGNAFTMAVGDQSGVDCSDQLVQAGTVLDDLLIEGNTFECTLDPTSPTDAHGTGVTLGKVAYAVIRNNTFRDLLGRAVGFGATIQTGLTSVVVTGNTIVDCGRTTGTPGGGVSASYRHAIALLTAVGFLVPVMQIDNNTIVNTSTQFMTGAVDVLADVNLATVRGNTVDNVPTPTIVWNAAGVVNEALIIDHVGLSRPAVVASPGSRWVDRTTGYAYAKSSVVTSTAWSAIVYASAPPGGGFGVAGDVTVNTAPVAGGPAGWVAIGNAVWRPASIVDLLAVDVTFGAHVIFGVGGNLLTTNQATASTDTTGVAAFAAGNATVARDVTDAPAGCVAAFLLTCLASGLTSGQSVSVRSTPTASPTFGVMVPCVAGDEITALASFEAVTTGRSCAVVLRFSNASNALVLSTTGTTVVDATGGYVQSSKTATAPAGAVGVFIDAAVFGPAQNEQHRVGALSIAKNHSTVWQAPGAAAATVAGRLDVTGIVVAAALAGKYKSGAGVTVTDADFAYAPPDGTVAVLHDTTSGLSYVAWRDGGAWFKAQGSAV